MKSIFDESSYNEITERLGKLNENSKRGWGKMSVGQMAWHCQYPLKIAVENKSKKVKGNPIFRWFFKKSMYNDKHWKKNLPTAPQLKTSEEKNFTYEVQKLQELVNKCHAVKERKEWNPHPLFGHLTREQWGQMQYKHLDHHLRQFGV
ncbi:hypothetical protein GGR42_003261 [Saonia flava]|uniref:DUF1569 domain-containing protein n=1 Tax=Saonia flava TaxID=523696 RepID=A0A846R0T4_9FLAO|nr:DUF1569 domain-containing protein [Saonia flava]NJB72770.1 hypothetical protein [Saonia flava]